MMRTITLKNSLLCLALVVTAGLVSSGPAGAVTLSNDPFVDGNQDGRWDSGAWGQDFPNLHYLRTTGAYRVWRRTTGQGIVIGTMDTGLDFNHPDIRDSVYKNPGESGGGKETNGIDDDGNGLKDDVSGWDYVPDDNDGKPGADNDPTDRNGHGTAVAGVAVATQGNGEGIAGVAPGAKILPMRITDDTGTSSINLGAGLFAAGYLTQKPDVDVISISGGLANHPLGAQLCAILDNAVRAGKIVVVAAGNGGTNGYPARDVGTPQAGGYSPAFCPNAITVTSAGPAMMNLGKNVTRSAFADFGANVLIGAPAGQGEITDPGPGPIPYSNNTILTLRAAGTNPVRRYIGETTDPNLIATNTDITSQVAVRQPGDPAGQPARYVRWRGTSFATPQVAATVALALSVAPGLRAKHGCEPYPECVPLGGSPSTSYPKLEAVKDILRRGAVRTTADPTLGAGLLNVSRSVLRARRYR